MRRLLIKCLRKHRKPHRTLSHSMQNVVLNCPPLILTTPTKPLKQQGKTELLEFQERPKFSVVVAPCTVCPYQTHNGFCGVCNKNYNNPDPPES